LDAIGLSLQVIACFLTDSLGLKGIQSSEIPVKIDVKDKADQFIVGVELSTLVGPVCRYWHGQTMKMVKIDKKTEISPGV
jgi:hypothetical protein